MSALRHTLPALLCAALFFTGTSLQADSKNPEDYPLRLHIFQREEMNHYHRGVEDFSKGTGRANLFANGEVHAVDFKFECGQQIESSLGYETYRAKWHQPGKKLTVLFPVFGESGKYFTCDLETDVKPDVAYFKHSGSINTEPIAMFKAWMERRKYDPEHGKNTPTSSEADK